MVNFDQLLEYDMQNVLQSLESEESVVLQKLSLACSEFRSIISMAIKDHLIQNEEFVRTSNSNSESITEVDNLRKTSEQELHTVQLNLKLKDREISNIIKRQEKLRENLKEQKEQKEEISLEIVDLEQEREERRKEKMRNWDALKRACFIYKDKLDIRLKVDSADEDEKVTVIFFVKEHQDKYYADLTHKANSWKVEKMEPDLKVNHSNELSSVIDFSNDFQVKNITAFLCRLRNIFQEHYFKK